MSAIDHMLSAIRGQWRSYAARCCRGFKLRELYIPEAAVLGAQVGTMFSDIAIARDVANLLVARSNRGDADPAALVREYVDAYKRVAVTLDDKNIIELREILLKAQDIAAGASP